MTMKTKYFILILAGLISVFFIFSCNKKAEICKECQIVPDGSKIMNIFLSQSSLKANVNYFSGSKGKINGFQIGTSEIDKDAFFNLHELYQKCSENGSLPFVVVIYFPNLFSETDILVEKDFMGYSIFYVKNNKIYHSFYKRTGLVFTEISQLSLEVNSIQFEQLNFIINNVVPNELNQPRSYILLRNEEIKIQKLDHPRNVFSLHMPFLQQEYSNFSTKDVGGGGGKKCTSPCSNMDDAVCVSDPYDGQLKCDAGICTIDNQISILKNHSQSVSPPDLYSSFNTNLLHDFRDVFLSKYISGQKYISYYYSIGSYIRDDIPLSLCISTALFFLNHNSDIEKLLNPNDHMNEILINTTFANDINNLISSYESLSSDSYYLQMFEELRTDVNHYQGKTIQEILNEIN
jgi:hypothetical protein